MPIYAVGLSLVRSSYVDENEAKRLLGTYTLDPDIPRVNEKIQMSVTSTGVGVAVASSATEAYKIFLREVPPPLGFSIVDRQTTKISYWWLLRRLVYSWFGI